MTKVIHYLPQINTKFICSKGGLHAEEPLNLVCLDPLCRNDPLGCSICYTNIHKHHKVVSVDKFIDEYSRNVKESSKTVTIKKIQNQHKTVKNLISKLKLDINQQLDNFQESIDEYADELRIKTNSRNYISKSLGIPLDPSKLKQNNQNNEQFVNFLKFILNNSLFDQNSNMIKIVDVLKNDEERIHALLDKMVNMTSHCQLYIKEVMKSLNFSDQTIKSQKTKFKKQIEEMKITQNQFQLEQFAKKQNLNKTLANTHYLEKQHWHKQLYHQIDPPINYNSSIANKVYYSFSQKNKHQMIEVKSKSKISISNITALKPQYVLLTPHINPQPNTVKQWTFHIKNCRNFASENTMGIGLSTLEDLKNVKFQGHQLKNMLLVTSQGYVLQNGNSRKTNLIFGNDDNIHCRYDPYYKLLEITKENGRKLTLKVQNENDEQLFACVRLTYASDQVQIV